MWGCLLMFPELSIKLDESTSTQFQMKRTFLTVNNQNCSNVGRKLCLFMYLLEPLHYLKCDNTFKYGISPCVVSCKVCLSFTKASSKTRKPHNHMMVPEAYL